MNKPIWPRHANAASAAVISALLLASLATGSAAQDRCAKVAGVWTANLSVNNETESGRILSSYVIEFKSDGTAMRRGKRSACSWSCSGNKVDVNCFPYSLDVANVDWLILADGKMSDANFPQNVAIRQPDPNVVGPVITPSTAKAKQTDLLPECNRLVQAMDNCLSRETDAAVRAGMQKTRSALIKLAADKGELSRRLCVADLPNWSSCLRTTAVSAPREEKSQEVFYGKAFILRFKDINASFTFYVGNDGVVHHYDNNSCDDCPKNHGSFAKLGTSNASSYTYAIGKDQGTSRTTARPTVAGNTLTYATDSLDPGNSKPTRRSWSFSSDGVTCKAVAYRITGPTPWSPEPKSESFAPQSCEIRSGDPGQAVKN